MRATRLTYGGLAVALALGGCTGLGTVSPRSPLAEGRRLLEEQQYAEAKEAFRDWLTRHPDDPRGQLGLGAAFEGMDQLDSAQALYDSLLKEPLPGRVRRLLEGRQGILRRRALALRAERLVQQEAEISARAPEANTIAVFPFTYIGADTALEPLGRALAQFVVTDLSQVRSLRLLERQEVQFLLDELALAQSGRVDPATGARAGRLLSAERVVTGALGDAPGAERVQLTGAAVRTATANIDATAEADDRLQSVFDLEKSVLLSLLSRMGIAVTPLEAERIAERPTASFQAFLAFGRGLEAEDRGDFRAAADAFGSAVRLDPSFSQAATRAAEAARMAEAANVSLARMASMLDAPLSDLAFVSDHLNDVMGNEMHAGDVIRSPQGADPPGGRDGVGDVGGEDRLGGIADIFIRIRRP